MTAKRLLTRAGLALFYLLATLYFLVIPLLLGLFLSKAGTRPQDKRLTEAPAPATGFEDISFVTDDGVMLRGWWLPRPGAPASLVLSHGLFRSRREVLQQAEFLWRSGYSVLAYDTRRHGESGGEFFTLGYFERLDVKAAIEQAQRRSGDKRVALWGISMGAVSSLRAAAAWRQPMAVIAESPFTSLRQTTLHHISGIFRLPGCPLAAELLLVMRLRAGLKVEEMELGASVRDMADIPLFLIASSDDFRMPPETIRRLLEQSHAGIREFWVARGRHGAAYLFDRDQYERRVLGFLQRVTRADLKKTLRQPL